MANFVKVDHSDEGLKRMKDHQFGISVQIFWFELSQLLALKLLEPPLARKVKRKSGSFQTLQKGRNNYFESNMFGGFHIPLAQQFLEGNFA